MPEPTGESFANAGWKQLQIFWKNIMFSWHL